MYRVQRAQYPLIKEHTLNYTCMYVYILSIYIYAHVYKYKYGSLYHLGCIPASWGTVHCTVLGPLGPTKREGNLKKPQNPPSLPPHPKIRAPRPVFSPLFGREGLQEVAETYFEHQRTVVRLCLNLRATIPQQFGAQAQKEVMKLSLT